jgi:hypothetical protein
MEARPNSPIHKADIQINECSDIVSSNSPFREDDNIVTT